MLCPLQRSGNSGIFLDYCARRLDSETAAQLQRHMSNCPECGRFAAGQAAVWAALDEWESVPASADFDQRLYQRISAQERRRFWTRVFGEGLSWKPALSFGAACATIAVMFVLNGPERRSSEPVSPPVQPVSIVESLEPDQIERSIEDFEMLRQFSTPVQTI